MNLCLIGTAVSNVFDGEWRLHLKNVYDSPHYSVYFFSFCSGRNAGNTDVPHRFPCLIDPVYVHTHTHPYICVGMRYNVCMELICAGDKNLDGAIFKGVKSR